MRNKNFKKEFLHVQNDNFLEISASLLTTRSIQNEIANS